MLVLHTTASFRLRLAPRGLGVAPSQRQFGGLGGYPLGAPKNPPTFLETHYQLGRISMDLELQGKVAIVTGGSRGIGKAIARELAREGVDVAIVARNKEALEATARELGAETNRRIIPLAADVTSKEQVDRMVAAAAQQ